MTAKEFIEYWLNKYADYDGYYGPQCVDLYDYFCQDVINCPIILVGGANEIWDNYPVDYFDRILNTPEAIPKLGDVMIWGTGVGNYGHVAICTDINNNQNTFVSLDQNWPVGSPCHYVEHNYNSVIGWLRPKVPSSSSITIPKETFEMLVGKATFADGVYALGIKDTKDIQNLRQELTDRNSYIEGQNAQIKTLNNSIAEIAHQLGVGNDYPTIIGEINKLKNGEDADVLLNQKIKDLSAELQLANADVEHYKQTANQSETENQRLLGALGEATASLETAKKSLAQVSAELEMAKKDIVLLKQQKGLITTISFLNYLIKIYTK